MNLFGNWRSKNYRLENPKTPQQWQHMITAQPSTFYGANQARLSKDCRSCRQKQEAHYAAVRSKLMMATTVVGAGTFACIEAMIADNKQFRNTDSLAHHFYLTGLMTGSVAGCFLGWTGAALYKSVDTNFTALFRRKCTCSPGELLLSKQPSRGNSQRHAPQVFRNCYGDDALRQHVGKSSSDGDGQNQIPLDNAEADRDTPESSDSQNQPPPDDVTAKASTFVSNGNQNQTPKNNGTNNFIENKSRFRRGFFEALRDPDSK